MSPIIERKRAVLALLTELDNSKTTSQFRHEMMAFCYVLVCAAIEYCVETILADWVKKAGDCHNKSERYPGRKFTESFIAEQIKFKEGAIGSFTSTKLEKIQELVKSVAGDDCSKRLKIVLGNEVDRNDLAARLERINRFRHTLAHGQQMPLSTQPNIQELKTDFLFVYSNLIQKINDCLPKI